MTQPKSKLAGTRARQGRKCHRAGAPPHLRCEAESFRLIADFTYDWECWIGPNGDYLYVSPSVERITGHAAPSGIQAEEFLRQVVHPEDLACCLEHQRERLAHPAASELEFRVVHRDGSVRWIHHLCQPVHDASGRFLGLRASNRDVTERKHALDQVARSEHHFRTVFESCPIGMALIDLDNRILDLNRAALRMHGFGSKDGITGRDSLTLVAPEHREWALQLRERALREGTVEGVELEQITQTGERLCTLVTVVRLDQVGKPYAFLAMAEDVTQRRSAEAKIANSERRYRNLYEAMRDAFASVDMSGQIRECNSAFLEITGYSEREIKTMTYRDITPGKWHAMEARIVAEQILPHGFSGLYEKEYIRKDGSIFPVELCTFLLRDDHGQPSAMCAIVRDISGRKAVEAQLLRQANELRAANEELTWFNRAMVGRELRMVELKNEINALCKQLGLAPRYPLAD